MEVSRLKEKNCGDLESIKVNRHPIKQELRLLKRTLDQIRFQCQYNLAAWESVQAAASNMANTAIFLTTILPTLDDLINQYCFKADHDEEMYSKIVALFISMKKSARPDENIRDYLSESRVYIQQISDSLSAFNDTARSKEWTEEVEEQVVTGQSDKMVHELHNLLEQYRDVYMNQQKTCKYNNRSLVLDTYLMNKQKGKRIQRLENQIETLKSCLEVSHKKLDLAWKIIKHKQRELKERTLFQQPVRKQTKQQHSFKMKTQSEADDQKNTDHPVMKAALSLQKFIMKLQYFQSDDIIDGFKETPQDKKIAFFERLAHSYEKLVQESMVVTKYYLQPFHQSMQLDIKEQRQQLINFTTKVHFVLTKMDQTSIKAQQTYQKLKVEVGDISNQQIIPYLFTTLIVRGQQIVDKYEGEIAKMQESMDRFHEQWEKAMDVLQMVTPMVSQLQPHIKKITQKKRR